MQMARGARALSKREHSQFARMAQEQDTNLSFRLQAEFGSMRLAFRIAPQFRQMENQNY